MFRTESILKLISFFTLIFIYVRSSGKGHFVIDSGSGIVTVSLSKSRIIEKESLNA